MTARTITLYLTVEAPDYTDEEIADFVFLRIEDAKSMRVVGISLPSEEGEGHDW